MALQREPLRLYQVQLKASAAPADVTYYAGATTDDIASVVLASGGMHYVLASEQSMGERARYAEPSCDAAGNPPVGAIDRGVPPSGGLPGSGLVLAVFEDNKGRFVYADGSVGSEKQYIQGSLKEQNAAGEPVAFEFYVNPANIDIKKNKHITKIRTRKGWEFQYWGAEIATISVQGSTGSILKTSTGAPADSSAPGGLVGTGEQSIYDTPAFRAFKALESLYDGDHRDESVSENLLLALAYRDRVFIGHFDSFQFSEDAEHPFSFKYSFQFSVQDEPTAIATTELAKQYATDLATIETLQRLTGVELQTTSAGA